MFEFIGSVLMFIFWFFVAVGVMGGIGGLLESMIFISKSPTKEEKKSQKEMFNKKSA